MNAVPSLHRAEAARRNSELDRLIAASKTSADRERDAFLARRVPELADEIATVDGSLALAIAGMDVQPAMLDAYRSGDDAELGRLVRIAALSRLCEAADLQASEEAAERYPEAI